jgi:hypothetical protein
VVINAIDHHWQEHLTEMEELRRSIGLRSYGQKDPLVEYKGEAYKYFEELMTNVRLQICTGPVPQRVESRVVREHARAPQSHRPRGRSRRCGRSAGAPQRFETSRRSRAAVPATGADAPPEQEIVLPKVTIRRETPKVGRNEPCPCGSGKKFKNCHGAEIFALGQEMLAHPVELLPGVAEIVPALARDYRLLLITKGDLHHQERKIAESGLTAHFSAIEILSEKDGATYERVLRRHGIAPDEFVMIGNSLKSDILPVLALGGAGVQVPYHLTWQHEHVEAVPHDQPRFRRVERLAELLPLLRTL